MKIGRNSPCPCGSGKKYKKCCLLNERNTQASISVEDFQQPLSDFEYIKPLADKVVQILKKYKLDDLTKAIFCLNLWRRNRSALAQGLLLNMALNDCETNGKQSIQSYEEFQEFYKDIEAYLKITHREDYIIDDYGEVFINHNGKSYPVITGTGHQQVYSVMRYMTTLTSISGRGEELDEILEYVDFIIENTKKANLPNENCNIIYELPTEFFWMSIKEIFENDVFKSKVIRVSEIIGFEAFSIERRHFINKSGRVYPLCNTSILVDYYNILLCKVTKEDRIKHIDQTIYSLIENSFNFSPDSPNRAFVKPLLIDKKTDKIVLSEGLFFAGFGKNSALFVFDERTFSDAAYISEIIIQIKELLKKDRLRIVESFCRKDSTGSYATDVKENCNIEFIIVNSYTDITSHAFFGRQSGQEVICTALDLLYFIGFSESFDELIEFVRYNKNEEAQVLSFGGKSNLFFTWKNANKLIDSGAIEYNHITLDYNESENYIYEHFKNVLKEFPRNNTTLFCEPLSWTVEKSDFEYVRVMHKGCIGFGGELKSLGLNTNVFLAHNITLFSRDDFTADAHTALKTIDELNQRLFMRYSKFLNRHSLLRGKTLQLIFIPWSYAKNKYSKSLLSDSSRTIVFSDKLINKDNIIIRYSAKPSMLLDAIKDAEDRTAENTYFKELLSPLRINSPEEFEMFEKILAKDFRLKKTVGVFQIEQEYYFSEESLDTKISPESFAIVKKEIAKVCYDSGVKSGEYKGKDATALIRKMQLSVVRVFESYLTNFDMFDLHKKVSNYYSVQLNGVIINLKRYRAFTGLDEEVQIEFEHKTREIREEYRRNIDTAKYLLESNLCVSHIKEARKCTKKDFEFLLAFSDWLVILQNDADTCYYTDFDLSISVDYEYKINTILSEEAICRYDDMLLRKYKTKDYHIKSDSDDLAYLEEAIKAFCLDTGINLRELLALLEYMQFDLIKDGIAKEIYPNVFEIDKMVLQDSFNNNLVEKIPDIKIIYKLIDYITLDTDLIKTIDGKQHDIIPIWEREKRDNRYDVKPIVVLNSKCIFSPIAMYDLLTRWKNGISEWYLPYEIGLASTNTVLKKWKKRYEDEMVQDIARLFSKANFDIVFPEVDLAHRFPNEKHPEELGDYDVIAINSSKKEFWIIESKVLQKVGSIYEDQMQQKSFFYQHKDDEKFQRRIDYAVKNTKKILNSFNIEDSSYTVIPYMVTNKLFASRYKKIKFPIITYDELRKKLEKYNNH